MLSIVEEAWKVLSESPKILDFPTKCAFPADEHVSRLFYFRSFSLFLYQIKNKPQESLVSSNMRTLRSEEGSLEKPLQSLSNAALHDRHPRNLVQTAANFNKR